MTTEQQNLNLEQKELVAVGASIGAGCQPCVSHHLNASAEAGLDGAQLLAAIASAERVSAENAVAIGDHARAKLDPDVSSAALFSRLEEALASLGAALGANDKTNIERQLRAASELGASRSQLQQAIETAHNVQENAARIHLREAKRLLDTIASTADADSGAGCGCDADAKRDWAPEPSEEPEPVAATGNHSEGCGPMATRLVEGGTSGAIAGCREMFERFMFAASPETEKAPTPPAAAGACKKEAQR